LGDLCRWLGLNKFMPLQFLRKLKLKRKPSSVSLLKQCMTHGIPSVPGVYLLIAKHRRFQYPNGRSPVYYIGQTKSLNKRIVKQHSVWHARVRSGKYVIEARHEYGGVYGGRYCYIQTWPGISPEKLEKKVIRAFMQRYYAPPVANGAQVWGWVEKIHFRKSK